MNKEQNSLPHESLVQELRRGTVVLAAISQLDQPQYGYSLLKRLSDQGFEIDQGTLYPLLRRLETNGLLESDWVVEESRPRRYYHLSVLGKETLNILTKEWQGLVETLDRILETKENE